MKKILAALVCATALIGYGLWPFASGFWHGAQSVPNVDSVKFISAGAFQIAVSVNPEIPRVGKNEILIEVRDAEGRAVEGAVVRAVGEMGAMGAMPPMYAPADIREVSPGQYLGDFELPMGGAWPFAIDVAKGDSQHVDLSFDLATSRKGIRLSTATPVSDVAYHTCSMHPSVKRAAPGTCPICGMNLVPVTHEDIRTGSIVLSQGRRQMIGVKMGHVERRAFSMPIILQGKVQHDERERSDISLRFDGWIGKLNANFEGKLIAKGEVLFTVYSPELLALQDEYIDTIRNKHSLRLQAAARKRLLLWGLQPEQLDELARRGTAQDYVPILAKVDGVVMNKTVVAGGAFKKGEPLLRLVDLSTVWVEAYAYAQDLALLTPEMPALIEVSGRVLQATVLQLDPFLNEQSRTVRVRLEADNVEGLLRPGLFAEVTLQANLGELLLIPEDAVLVSGQKRFVFVDRGEGRLQPVKVRLGYSDGEYVVVRDGLSVDDAIVVSGNFLIAAESKLKSGIEQW